MTRRADRFFMQQQLRELNFDEPAFEQRPPLLGAQPESPEHEQFDSAWEDVEEEGGVTSGLDAELGTSTGKETEVSGCPRLRGVAEETRSCRGSVLGHDEISGCLEINAFVFRCSEKPLKKMLFPIETGVARSRMPSRGAMMLPKSRKLCSRP